jgi:hypothetical protein
MAIEGNLKFVVATTIGLLQLPQKPSRLFPAGIIDFKLFPCFNLFRIGNSSIFGYMCAAHTARTATSM